MAQPIATRLEYLGSFVAAKGKNYTAQEILNAFSDSTSFIMKSKGAIGADGKRQSVRVSINGTPFFDVDYDEVTAYDGVSDISYSFDQDCIIVAAKDLDVTP